MQKVTLSLEQAMKIERINRYVVEGLPLKTYDCSQISDGYAALILATEEGLARLGVRKADCVELAGFGQATDPLKKAGREVLRPAGAFRAMQKAYERAGVTAADVNVADGATGIAMVGWCTWQLLGRVPAELQVKQPRVAATFNIGGPICASVCTVLRPAA
jgi:acetyl-CoA acetyltransferase